LLPRYAVLPRALLAEHGVEGKVTVNGSLNGVAFKDRLAERVPAGR